MKNENTVKIFIILSISILLCSCLSTALGSDTELQNELDYAPTQNKAESASSSNIPIKIYELKQCRDHIDNDGDGYIDYGPDKDCSSRNDDSEKVTKIILVVSDSLRADHLGCYGYERDTSPNIDEFALEGVNFLHDTSQARWTLESFTSILSSLHTITHKVTRDHPLDECWVTLPEVLQSGGYETMAFSNGPKHANGSFQGQGFDNFYWSDSVGDTEITDKAMNWLNSNHDESFFLMVHYLSPHSPYSTGRNFYGDEYSDNFDEPYPICEEDQEQGINCISLAISENEEHDIDYYVGKYDGEIEHMDSEFGRLMNEVERLGIEDDTLIVFTGDHGEVFAKHGIILSHIKLYDDTLHVALMMRYPGVISTKKVDKQVQSIDIMPTILDYAELEGPETMQGNSLRSLINGEAYGTTNYVFSGERDYHDQYYAYSLRSESWKLIENQVTGEKELYYLKDDPEELTNLAEKNPLALLKIERELQKNVFEYGFYTSCEKEIEPLPVPTLSFGPHI